MSLFGTLDQAGVAVGEETVAGGDCMGVGGLDPVEPGERVRVPLGVYLATHGVDETPKELLDTVLTGAENAQKQAAQQLANSIATARNEEDAAARAGTLAF